MKLQITATSNIIIIVEYFSLALALTLTHVYETHFGHLLLAELLRKCLYGQYVNQQYKDFKLQNH